MQHVTCAEVARIVQACRLPAACRAVWYWATGTCQAVINPDSRSVCGELTLGGYSDWRLPSKKELISILDLAVPLGNQHINAAYFPNSNKHYWSSTGEMMVNFSQGTVGDWYPKTTGFSVRCVRGGSPASAAEAASLVDNGDGTVTDQKTGLIWQQGEPGIMDVRDALSYCEGLSLGGADAWRLPNYKELESLTVDLSESDLAIDATGRRTWRRSRRG